MTQDSKHAKNSSSSEKTELLQHATGILPVLASEPDRLEVGDSGSDRPSLVTGSIQVIFTNIAFLMFCHPARAPPHADVAFIVFLILSLISATFSGVLSSTMQAHRPSDEEATTETRPANPITRTTKGLATSLFQTLDRLTGLAGFMHGIATPRACFGFSIFMFSVGGFLSIWYM